MKLLYFLYVKIKPAKGGHKNFFVIATAGSNRLRPQDSN